MYRTHRRLRAALAILIVAVIGAACSSQSSETGVGELGGAADSTEIDDGSVRDSQAPTDTTDTETKSGSDGGQTAQAVRAAASASIERWSAACESGSDPGCDIVFAFTAHASEDELDASTCAGRSETPVAFCTAGIELASGELWFDDQSPGLDQVVRDCETGDGVACDFLYIRSAVGSPYEDIGLTCGGRVAVANPDCASQPS